MGPPRENPQKDAIRLLMLGVAEVGFFPGVAFYLAFWSPTQYRARILAGFLVAIASSTVVGVPLSGLLLALDGMFGLAGWEVAPHHRGSRPSSLASSSPTCSPTGRRRRGGSTAKRRRRERAHRDP